MDHCTFFDCADGALDIGRGSGLVTVSGCKFYYHVDHNHNYANLIGSTDEDGSATKQFHVTFHHNWWSGRGRQRMPSNRFDSVHIYNNYNQAPETFTASGVACSPSR